jgi:biopolymer transport protein ExbD
MSEVQVKEEGGGKNKQKKQTLRVDFTPMVDMNMLLITFFMFCTTLLKPQTMNITMPSKEDVKDEEKTTLKESTAITVILGANDNLYYYLGMIAEDGSSYEDDAFLVTTTYDENGLRKLLLEKNRDIYPEVQELKVQKNNGKISEEEYNTKVQEIQTKAIKESRAPSVLIKPTDKATYKNTVDVLDEMLVCNIGSYQLTVLNEGDRHLLYKKTGNLEYLSDEEKAKLAK